MSYVSVSIPNLALPRGLLNALLAILIVLTALGAPVLPRQRTVPASTSAAFEEAEVFAGTQMVVPGQVPAGFSPADWHVVEGAIAEAEYHLVWRAADQRVASPYYWAPNRRQGWNVTFAETGTVEVTSATGESWRWGLALTGYGYQDNVTPMAGMPSASADAERLTYRWNAGLSEWWTNGPGGLEQGFTLLTRPASNAAGLLAIEMAVRGDLTPRQTGPSIEFADESGATVLRYGKLYVFDAEGKAVPARLELAGDQRLRILIDDSNAVYPLIVDPITESAKLTASDGAEFDDFARSVAIDGDTVVVGAPGDDVGSGGWNRGSAYVFVKSGGGWATGVQTAKLTASDGAAYDTFGTSVGVSGDTVVVGSPVAAPSGAGAVYVFEKPSSGWASGTETAKLTASDASTNAALGRSVAIDGDSIVAGTYIAAYVFVKPGGGWANGTETAKLTASDGQQYDQFGASVDIEGNVVVVGSGSDDIGANADQGSAYVFVAAGSWSTSNETAKLTASDGAAGDFFGQDVAISGDTIVVGAVADHVGSIADAGSVYVFEKPVSGWATGNETEKLSASDAAASDQFGGSVDIDGNVLVVGAAGDDPRGSAYAFVRSTGDQVTGFTEAEKLLSGSAINNPFFGQSVGVRSGTILVGAFAERIGVNNYQGAAYVFADAVPLAVTLASFDATAQPDHILVTWETVSELDNTGFNLYRGASSNWDSATLLASIPSQAPGSAQGSAYSYVDVDVQPGQTVWYWLEDIGLNGVATRHGPISAAMQAPTAVTVTAFDAATQQPAGGSLAGVALLVALAVAGLGIRRRKVTATGRK